MIPWFYYIRYYIQHYWIIWYHILWWFPTSCGAQPLPLKGASVASRGWRQAVKTQTPKALPVRYLRSEISSGPSKIMGLQFLVETLTGMKSIAYKGFINGFFAHGMHIQKKYMWYHPQKIRKPVGIRVLVHKWSKYDGFVVHLNVCNIFINIYI